MTDRCWVLGVCTLPVDHAGPHHAGPKPPDARSEEKERYGVDVAHIATLDEMSPAE